MRAPQRGSEATAGLMSYVYASKSLVAPHSLDMLDIIRTTLVQNEAHDLSGFLYFDKFYFLQVLEGPENVVARLRDNLLRDKRHYAMQDLRSNPIDQRSFGLWRMAFCDGTSHNPLFGFTLQRGLIEEALAGNATGLLSVIDRLHSVHPRAEAG